MKINKYSLANAIANKVKYNLDEINDYSKINFMRVLNLIDDLETDDPVRIIIYVVETLAQSLNQETQNKIIDEIINDIEFQYKIKLI